MGLLKKITLGVTATVLISTGMGMYHANRLYYSKSPQLDELTQIEYGIDLTGNQLDAELKLRDIADPSQITRFHELSEQYDNYKNQYARLIEGENLKEIKANHDCHMNRFGIYNGISLFGLLFLGCCGLAYCSNPKNYSKEENKKSPPDSCS